LRFAASLVPAQPAAKLSLPDRESKVEIGKSYLDGCTPSFSKAPLVRKASVLEMAFDQHAKDVVDGALVRSG